MQCSIRTVRPFRQLGVATSVGVLRDMKYDTALPEPW